MSSILILVEMSSTFVMTNFDGIGPWYGVVVVIEHRSFHWAAHSVKLLGEYTAVTNEVVGGHGLKT